MRRFLALAVCLAAVSSTAWGDDEIEVEFYSFTHESLFPSAIISTALTDWDPESQTAEDHPQFTESSEDVPLYGDENGWLGVNLTGLPEEAEVEVQITIDRILKTSKWSGTMKEGHADALIIPKAAWNYDALHQVREERPVNVEIRVTVDEEVVAELTEVCVLKSVNDCPFYVFAEEGGEDFDDISVVFAAYVNENHPFINGVLKDALETEIVSAFTGYQSGDPEEVAKQVFAVWTALHERGISYSDVSTTTPSKTVASQTVRFLDESIKSQQANCVDGSVMLASILRKIGLHVHLVMVPGHCLLAFDLDKEGTKMLGLETTLLGDDSETTPDELPEWLQNFDEYDSTTAFPSYASAILSGTGTVVKYAEDFDTGEDPNTQIISVDEARKMGIRPIAMKQGAKP